MKVLDWKIWIVVSLTLGLAPFNEPHVWGKLQWVLGGAVGMKPMDWFDFFSKWNSLGDDVYFRNSAFKERR